MTTNAAFPTALLRPHRLKPGRTLAHVTRHGKILRGADQPQHGRAVELWAPSTAHGCCSDRQWDSTLKSPKVPGLARQPPPTGGGRSAPDWALRCRPVDDGGRASAGSTDSRLTWGRVGRFWPGLPHIRLTTSLNAPTRLCFAPLHAAPTSTGAATEGSVRCACHFLPRGADAPALPAGA